MGSRKHRWPGDDHPLIGVHGGTAKAAQRAIKAAKEARLYERARKAVRMAHVRAVQDRLDAVDRGGKLIANFKRKDKLRPKKRGTGADPPLIERIAFIQQGRCVLCGEGLVFGPLPTPLGCHVPRVLPQRPTFEHVIPRALGGKNVGNRLVTHYRCNHAKGRSKPTGCELVMLLAVNARLGVEPTRF